MTVQFIGIGAQKAGTSWLYHHLASHPEVRSPHGLFDKEIDFFTWRYSRGYRWYEQHFDGSEGSVAGEFSNGYLLSADAVDRIKAYNPDARLLVLLRDPIDRAISQHRHEVRKRNIPRSHWDFSKAMEANPTYVLQGMYSRHLKRYLSVFRSPQIWVRLFDDIIQEPLAVVQSAYAHVGVGSTNVPTNIEQRVNDGTYQRNALLNRVAADLGPIIRGSRLDRPIARIAASGPIRALMRTNRQVDIAVPPLSESTLIALRGAFSEDVRALESLIERDLSHWLDVDQLLDKQRRRLEGPNGPQGR